MKRLTIHTKRYPNLSVVVSERPTDGKEGSFLLFPGVPVELTDTAAKEVEAQYAGYPERVRRAIRMDIVSLDEQAESAPPIEVPVAAQPTKANTDSGTTVPPADDSTEEVKYLSEEDQALIQIEVEKIIGKTVAEASPIVEKTALNDELPLLLRQSYLDELLKRTEVQKSLKEKINDLKDAIAPVA